MDLVRFSQLEIKILTKLALINLNVNVEDAQETLYALHEDAEDHGRSSSDGVNFYRKMDLPDSIKNSLSNEFDYGFDARQDFLKCCPPTSQLHEEWNGLDLEEQCEIIDDIYERLELGRCEMSSRWYPLLKPRIMQGYVGD
jgi:hypothetical protein